ncbi:MAG: fibronectin type III domain-containing protein [Actinomycetota bacterium]|nr:fibronectin type III domain-containing protein [Actinomycetota bacterium]
MNARRLVRPVALAVALVVVAAAPASAETPRPTGLTATAASSSAITLRWTDASSNEIGFEIQRSPANTTTFKKIATAPTNATTYGDTELTAATAYKYRVRALKPVTGASSWSTAATASTLGGSTTTTPGTTLPSVPSGLVASPVSGSCSSIILDWNDSTPGTHPLKDYVVWRDGVFLKYVTAPTTVTTDNGLVGARTYSYAVQARDTLNNPSAKSAPKSATTPTCPTNPTVPVPGAFKANATSCGFAVASWNPIFDPNGTYGITKYNLYRNNVLTKTVNAPAGTAVDTGLAPLTTYSYAVTAVNAANQESAKSAPVTTTTIACPPAGAWSKTVGGTGSEYGRSVAVDAAGNTVIGGTFRGAANFGNGDVTSSPAGDIFVAKYSPAGALLWANNYPSEVNGNELNSVATDAAGNVFVAGAFFGTFNLGGGQLVNGQSGYRDAFVAKYSPTGAHLWSRRFGGIIDDAANAVAVDNFGNPVFTGFFRGKNIDFAGKPLTSAVFGGYDAFVVKLSSATGTSSLAFATPCGSIVAHGIAIGPNNEIVIAGALSVACNFGSGFVTQNNTDVFVAKYDASGSFLWAKAFGNMWGDGAKSVAVDGSGNVIIAGSFAEVVDFGTGPLGKQGWDGWAFVAKYTSSGVPVWSKGFGGGTMTQGNGVAVDAAGRVTLVGTYGGTIDFGGGPLVSGGSGYNAYVVQYSSSGAHIASNRYGTFGITQAQGVTRGLTGAVVTGMFTDTTDFGFGPVQPRALNDLFILNTGR